MAKVNFIRQDSGLILVRYRYSGKLLRYSTQQKVDAENWDKENSEVLESDPDPETKNDELKKIRQHVENIEKHYRVKLEQDLPVETFKTKLNVALGREKAKPVVKPDLLIGFEDYISSCEMRKTVTPGTLRGWRVVLGKIQKYAKYKKIKRIEFGDINGDFYDSFISWMKEQKYSKTKDDPKTETYTDAYIGRYISVLKIYLNKEWDRNNSYFEGVKNPGWKAKDFKVMTEDSENIYLNPEQLKIIEEKDFRKFPRLARVRDAFLIGCWTGLRFSDYSQLTPENFVTIKDTNGQSFEVLKITTQKTKKSVVIPVHSCIHKIMNNYNGGLPRVPSNQKFNEYVKEVVKLSGLTELITIEKPVNGERKQVQSPLYKEVSSHTARRSFATNMYESGVQSITIMAITGHKTEKSFLKYIKTGAEKHALIMAKSPLFSKIEEI